MIATLDADFAFIVFEFSADAALARLRTIDDRPTLRIQLHGRHYEATFTPATIQTVLRAIHKAKAQKEPIVVRLQGQLIRGDRIDQPRLGVYPRSTLE
jgi:hypothetical protein